MASGKGGTGKTTIATALAACLAEQWLPVFYADCDVEEPNGHIFLKPEIKKVVPVGVSVPAVNEESCTHCGLCARTCQFSAIVCVGKQVMTFPELCHGCGGCALACPESAIHEFQRHIGQVQAGSAGTLGFVGGILRVGEAMSAPLVRAVKEYLPDEAIAVIDAPPGTSCPVIEAVKDTDFVLLVTEPTPFGLNDLKLAVEMVRELEIPFGVVINRCDVGTDETRRYCARENIRVLLEIPHDRRIAKAYSHGHMLFEAAPELKHDFLEFSRSVRRTLSKARL